ncbi:hypothetical protein AVEN_67024-1 [Araneus ventricosus]|uniref:Uncharacterized protein n=1 Tax=Araneus ventricosus TaxID=182803 RepID=A0A4Y2E596_ARAVE|nr:hypothetical protein AVEN_67024-1 [Araneus ventricosus]
MKNKEDVNVNEVLHEEYLNHFMRERDEMRNDAKKNNLKPVVDWPGCLPVHVSFHLMMMEPSRGRLARGWPKAVETPHTNTVREWRPLPEKVGNQ